MATYSTGTVILMPKSITPEGFIPCDGRELDPSKDGLLYAVVGPTLPKLNDKFGFHHLLCSQGEFSTGVKYTVDFDGDNFVGTVVPFEGNTIPNGWALCDGLRHAAEGYKQLASVLGTFQVAGKSGEFFDLPNTGNERYIICAEGEFPH
jgi:microcystin-dependent protein